MPSAILFDKAYYKEARVPKPQRSLTDASDHPANPPRLITAPQEQKQAHPERLIVNHRYSGKRCAGPQTLLYRLKPPHVTVKSDRVQALT